MLKERTSLTSHDLTCDIAEDPFDKSRIRVMVKCICGISSAQMCIMFDKENWPSAEKMIEFWDNAYGTFNR
jgi:hypothetical protein